MAQPHVLTLEVSDTEEALEIRSPVLRVHVNKRSGALAFHRADGSLVTRERDDSPADIEPVRIDGEPSYAIRHSFTLTPGESLYGLGQYNEPYMDYRGRNDKPTAVLRPPGAGRGGGGGTGGTRTYKPVVIGGSSWTDLNDGHVHDDP